jgi:hypothetical protein
MGESILRQPAIGYGNRRTERQVLCTGVEEVG